jgi:hypothetical protein
MSRYFRIGLIAVAIGGVSLFTYDFLYRKPAELSRVLMGNLIAKPCIGKIELIDDNQRDIYFIMNGTKYSFGKVGRFEIYYYATVGDSLIKEANSKLIKVVKPDGSFKVFVLPYD